MSVNCPSRQTLLQFSIGLLPDEQSDELADHLGSCPDCQATILTLEDAEDTLIGHLRTPAGSQSCLAESEFQAALAEAIALPAGGASGGGGGETPVSIVPQMLGEYQILSELGRGGMGRVYKALHTKLDRMVALKVLPRSCIADHRAIARFEREMKAVGRLAHPNIVQAADAREIDGTPVLIMEFVDGLDLGRIARRLGCFPVADAC
jgi:serine/threonine protein kinase